MGPQVTIAFGSGEYCPLGSHPGARIEIPILKSTTGVIIKVSACALTPLHHKVTEEWLFPDQGHLLPIGCDVAGRVTVVGSQVQRVKVGDYIVGLLPITSDSTGCAEYCVIEEFNLVKHNKSGPLSDINAVAALGDCVRAYMAFHYLGHVTSADTILIMDGASAAGYMMIQVAQHWCSKVITTVSSSNEYAFLERHKTPAGKQELHIIEVGEKNKYLSNSVLEETGGLGVQCIVDNGVRIFTNEEDVTSAEENYTRYVPHKHDLISCLAVGGKWVTRRPDLQLDPPDSLQLYMRGASLCFLFEPVGTLTQTFHGKYQNMLHDIMDKLERNHYRPNINKVISFNEVTKTLDEMREHQIGKTVVKM